MSSPNASVIANPRQGGSTTVPAEERWARDADFDHCISCAAKFSLLTRRHHCRSCGELFCERCSSTSARIPSHPDDTDDARHAKKRVCKHCAAVVTAAVAGAGGGDYRHVHAYAAYRVLMVTSLDPLVRRHRTATLVNNIFAFDIKEIQGRMADVGNHPYGAAQQQLAAPPADSTPVGRLALLGSSNNNNKSLDSETQSALSLIFHSTSSKQHEHLLRLMDTTNEHGLRLRVILSKRSLTAFYEVVHALLVHVFGFNIIAAGRGCGNDVRSIAPLPVSPPQPSLDLNLPKTSQVLFEALLLAGRSGRGVAEAAPCLSIDSVIAALSEFACALTMRYEEQLACLRPPSAVIVAETAVLRIVTRCQAMENGAAAHDSGSFHELFFSAILHERSTTAARPLSTLLPEVDHLWTDDGVLSCCGLRTLERRHYDPVYLDSGSPAAGQAAASASASGDERASLIRKYYYRLGTDDEAAALRVNATGMLRHAKTPVWSVERQFEEQQLLCRFRELLLLGYASARLQPASGCWASTASVSTPRSTANRRGGAAGGPLASTAFGSSAQQSFDDVIRRCRDLCVNLDIFLKMLRSRCAESERELDDIYKRLQELAVRVEDVATESYCAASTRGYLASLQRLQSVAETQEVTQKLAVFTKYRYLLHTHQKPVVDLYLLVRLRLLMAVLSSAQPPTAPDDSQPVRLLGSPVPRMEGARRALDALIVEANLNPLFRSWSRADIADRHLELVARTVAERYANVALLPDAASLTVLADCLVARLLRLLTHPREYGLQPSQLFDVAMVERVDAVALKDTVAGVQAVYLHALDGTPLKEHSVHTKAGLASPDGRCFVGVRPKLPSAAAGGLTRGHHKPLKYGHLFMFPGEYARKKLMQVGSSWMTTSNGKPTAAASSKMSMAAEIGSTLNSSTLLTTSPVVPVTGVQFNFCVVSVCPRHVSPGDLIGITLLVRGKDSVSLPSGDLPDKDSVVFVGISDSQCVITMGGGGGGEGAGPQKDAAGGAETAGGIIRGSTKCCTAGTFVAAALWRGMLLTSNAVQVRPTAVDWTKHSTLDVTPSSAIYAGDTVTVRVMLRDMFGNLTCSSGPDDFTVAVDNEGPVVPSAVTEEPDGSFVFSFIPTTHGSISIVVGVAGTSLKYSQRALTCLPGPTDFKNSLFSFDEVEVDAGQCVRGILMLRDTFGNKVIEDEEHPVIDASNSSSQEKAITLERLSAGEYAFDFYPTRAGHAIVTATSRRSSSSLVARVTVRSPATLSWGQCTVRCASKRLFAGDEAIFQVLLRDEFGNAASVTRTSILKDFSWVLKYVSGPHSGEEVEAHLTGPCDTANGEKEDISVSSMVVSAIVTRAGSIAATFWYSPSQSEHISSDPVIVDSGVLDWSSSAVVAPAVASVGSSVSVLIECRDRFGNAASAHVTDFTAAVRSSVDDTPAKVQPLTIQSPSLFSFNFIAVRAGATAITVTYAGHSQHTVGIELSPSSCYFSNCVVELATASRKGGLALLAGQDVVLSVRFKDIYNNDCPAVPDMLTVEVYNESSACPTTLLADSACEDVCSDLSLLWCRSYFATTVYKAGRVGAIIAKTDSFEEKRSNTLSVAHNALDWTHSRISTTPAGRIRAGQPLTVTIALFDTYDNPVLDVQPDSVELEANNVCNDQRGVTSAASVVLKKSGVAHELVGTTVPEIAGKISMAASLLPLSPTAAGATISNAIFGPPLRAEVAVEAADLDWKGKSSVELLSRQSSVVAGCTVTVVVRFRDGMGNPVPASTPAIESISGTASCDSTVVAFSFSSHQKEEFSEETDQNSLTLTCTPVKAGTTLIAVNFAGAQHPTTHTLTVLPAPCSWASSTSAWNGGDSQPLTAGLLAELVIFPRDEFGNETTDGLPDPAALVAIYEGEPDAVVPAVRREGNNFVVSFTPTLAVPETVVSVTAGSLTIRSEAQSVQAGVPYWPHCILCSSSSGDKQVADIGSVVAGIEFFYTLRLADKYHNKASSKLDQLEVLVSHAERAEDELTGLVSIVTSADDSGSIFTVRVTAQLAGKHSAATGLVGVVGEDGYLTLAFLVEPGPVDWPTGCELFADSDVVSAGTEVFVTAVFRDRFGNFTTRGWSPAQLAARAYVESVTVASDVSVMTLPHSSNEVSFVIATSIVGKTTIELLLMAASSGHQGTSSSSVLTVLVLPGEPSLEHCSLFPAVPETVAGDVFYFGLVVRDRFGNVCVGRNASTAVPSSAADDDTALLVASVAEYIEQTARLVCAKCTNTNSQVALISKHLPSHIRSEELVATVSVLGAASSVPSTPLQVALVGLRCSIAISVTPLIAGEATLTLSHADSDAVLSASVAITCRPFRELKMETDIPALALTSFPTEFVAGSMQALRFVLRDAHGNILTEVYDGTVACMKLLVHSGSAFAGPADFSTSPVGIIDGFVLSLPFVVTKATDRDHSTTLSLTGEDASHILGKASTRIVPSAPSASKSSFGPLHAPSSPSHPAAGSAISVKLFLSDGYGNSIRSLGDQQLLALAAALECENGLQKPSVSIQCAPDGDAFELTATPTDALTAHFVFKDGTGVRKVSPTVAIHPGPLHWPSCTLRIIEDNIKAGSEASVLMQMKDAHGNAVTIATSDPFTVEFENNGNVTTVANAFAGAAGKNLTASFRPTERGTAFCRVTYAEQPGDLKISNVIRVV